MNAVEKWFIIRDSLLELQKKATTDSTKRQVKKPIKRKKERTK